MLVKGAREQEEWRKHPEYIADCGGVFGTPPNLKCQYCERRDYELFYGHCKSCAIKKEIPQNMADPYEFHEAVRRGETTIVKGLPKKNLPWWSLRRWISLRA